MRNVYDSLIAYCAAPLTKQDPAVFSAAAFQVVLMESWKGSNRTCTGCHIQISSSIVHMFSSVFKGVA